MNNNIVYTIGYSGFSMEDFLKTIKKKNIVLVVDVRSSPYSKYYQEYNRENIKSILEKEKIYYRNYIAEFGARQDDAKYYPNGYMDFELFSKSEQFLSGIKKLENALKQGYTFALFCGEKDPIDCHRSILITKEFVKRGFDIIHILPNDVEYTQKDIEKRLLDEFFPNREQITLFEEQISDEEYINKAYQLQNRKIGYYKNNEKTIK